MSDPLPTALQETSPDLATITAPRGTDGPEVHALIAASPPLDANSLYCNLLQCTHFAETCAIARRDGEVVGFLSGYVEPKNPDALFIWQIVVRKDARGTGLAKKMLFDVLSRPACAGVTHLEATITENNAASWALFASFARALGAAEKRTPMFDKDANFGGTHDTEILISIGPFAPLRNP